jgi:diazepam-binding inhibitor (GABA receptor modulating acyl-CoA-binding protein)
MLAGFGPAIGGETMELQAEFEQALAQAKNLAAQPPDVLLQLYGLYKQATEGDVTGERPGMLDFKGAAKHDAWARHRGTSPEEAKREYVQLVRRLAAG